MNRLLQLIDNPNLDIPFDKIDIKDFEASISIGIDMHNAEIDKIIHNEKEPSFYNTIEALEYSGFLLDKTTTIFYNLLSSETNDEMDKLSEKLSPIISDHYNSVLHNMELFVKVRYVYNLYTKDIKKSSSLTSEQKTLLNNTYEEFIRNGAMLNESEKKELTQLKSELSLLCLKFSQNHLKDLNDYRLNITNYNDIENLPQPSIDSAFEEAKAMGYTGWLFTLQSPSYIPFITYCKKRELRKKIYLAYNTLCTHNNGNNNIDLVKLIVNKRLRISQILGFTNFAEYQLCKRMAGNINIVNNLFTQLVQSYMPYAKSEVKEVELLAKEIEGPDFVLMPWDFAYYSNKLKERKFNINSETFRPYLLLDNVKTGLFKLADILYDISFIKNDKTPVYHKDVEVYDVFDSEKRYIAKLYFDFFPRPTKKSGAWMTSYQDQFVDKTGNKIFPQVSITTNFSKPSLSSPSLLTFSEFETFVHEFGHALHGILSDVTYKSLSGTNVYWDFVEFPSQFMENFCTEKDFLCMFARHYITGESIPNDLLENLIKSKNFNVAYSCIRQVSFGMLDMNYYSRNEDFKEDVINNEKAVFDKVRLLPYVPNTCMSTQFSHIMSGGYAAGYYSYKWSEVIDADAFSVFKKNGLFNKAIAQKLKDTILSRGGTENPMALYKNFRGEYPSINALLERNGLLNNIQK